MCLGSQSRAYNYEWIEAMQVQNLITCTAAGVRAALMRRESRGHHIRSDYPQVDHDNWLKRIVVANDNGKIVLTTRDIASTRISLPTGKVENIMQYAIECGK